MTNWTGDDADVRDSPHPGYVLEWWLLKEGRSQTWLADQISVSLKHVNRIIHGRARFSVDVALKLGRLTGIPARSWMHLQADADLAAALDQELARGHGHEDVIRALGLSDNMGL